MCFLLFMDVETILMLQILECFCFSTESLDAPLYFSNPSSLHTRRSRFPAVLFKTSEDRTPAESDEPAEVLRSLSPKIRRSFRWWRPKSVTRRLACRQPQEELRCNSRQENIQHDTSCLYTYIYIYRYTHPEFVD